MEDLKPARLPAADPVGIEVYGLDLGLCNICENCVSVGGPWMQKDTWRMEDAEW